MRIEDSTAISFFAESKLSEQLKPADPSFSSWLGSQISETNEKLLSADLALEKLAGGEATNLHQTMLTMEQAKLSFQFLEQVRNRLMSAYQEILREQI